ncbi:hypothetical protein DL96DRAFT_1627133, partial [Flagelloscypha sp. PMI_526]
EASYFLHLLLLYNHFCSFSQVTFTPFQRSRFKTFHNLLGLFQTHNDKFRMIQCHASWPSYNSQQDEPRDIIEESV